MKDFIMNRLKNFIVNRLKEASTWRGLIALATALGLHVSPELSAAIIPLGLALMGAVGVVTPDKKVAMSINDDPMNYR